MPRVERRRLDGYTAMDAHSSHTFTTYHTKGSKFDIIPIFLYILQRKYIF